MTTGEQIASALRGPVPPSVIAQEIDAAIREAEAVMKKRCAELVYRSGKSAPASIWAAEAAAAIRALE